MGTRDPNGRVVKAQPFESLAVHLASGPWFTGNHRELAACSVTGREMLICNLTALTLLTCTRSA
jgi:hypothetical protein